MLLSLQLPPSEPTFAITKLLMEHDADLTLVNKHGKTPVQLCRDPRLREILLPNSVAEDEWVEITSDSLLPTKFVTFSLRISPFHS